MSWQSYIDSNLVGSGKFSRAAILGQQGGVWAASPGYELSTEEQKEVTDAHNNLSHTMSSGLKLAGQRFFYTSADTRSIYLNSQAGGAIVLKTKQAIIVAEYAAPIQAVEAAQQVESLADYLISVGF
ncbi:profilin-1A [Aspergillus sergii]|uniref:Profilin n=1 Tax=Aspergillus sergii TaxID=1034303 RepID=A0A5N6XEF8_9EURO|nr:profilin-1A [Aspergillus sergii]